MTLTELRRMEEANKVSSKINIKIIQLHTILNYEKNPKKIIQKLKDEILHLSSIHREMKNRINNTKGNFLENTAPAVDFPKNVGS